MKTENIKNLKKIKKKFMISVDGKSSDIMSDIANGDNDIVDRGSIDCLYNAIMNGSTEIFINEFINRLAIMKLISKVSIEHTSEIESVLRYSIIENDYPFYESMKKRFKDSLKDNILKTIDDLYESVIDCLENEDIDLSLDE